MSTTDRIITIAAGGLTFGTIAYMFIYIALYGKLYVWVGGM